jgi:hypothetical protein
MDTTDTNLKFFIPAFKPFVAVAPTNPITTKSSIFKIAGAGC